MNFSVVVIAAKVLGLLAGLYALSYILRVAAGLYLYLAANREAKTSLEALVRRIFPGIAHSVDEDRAELSPEVVEQTDARIRAGYQQKRWLLLGAFVGVLLALFILLYFLVSVE